MLSQTVRRTAVTSLSDAELVIIDVAAMCIARRRHYKDSIFREQWNRPSHGLDDKTLLRTLHRFEAEGLITSEACYDQHGRPDRTVKLTRTGGALWESERLPDWERYVMDMYSRRRIAIYSYTRETCERYFHAACDCKLIVYDGGTIRHAVANRSLVYWRTPQPVHLLSARIKGEFSEIAQPTDVHQQGLGSHQAQSHRPAAFHRSVLNRPLYIPSTRSAHFLQEPRRR